MLQVCVVSQCLLKVPETKKGLGMAGFLGLFSSSTSESLLGNVSVHGMHEFPGTSFPRSY